jgi:hypothetical protein
VNQNKKPKVRIAKKQVIRTLLKKALIKWDSQGPKALEPPEGGVKGSGRSPEGVNQCFLK